MDSSKDIRLVGTFRSGLLVWTTSAAWLICSRLPLGLMSAMVE